MATFWKDIKNKYRVNSFQNTKNTYDWIIKALNKGKFEYDEMRIEFLFDVSGMVCSCTGIEEFIENAYNQEGYSLTDMSFSFWPKNSGRIGICVKHDNRISISTSTKVMLERVVNLLEYTSLDETEVNNPISVMYVETQINNDGVIIHGDGNTVANNHSEIELEGESKESEPKQFWTGILQNITSNFLWYLLTLVAGGVLTYLATN